MNNKKHYIIVSLILIIISGIMFFMHYLIFGQAENTAYYSLMSFCFIPINTLVVTVVLENLIAYRAKKERMNKINMLVSLFFSEIGYDLMGIFIKSDFTLENYKSSFTNLDDMESTLKNHSYSIDMNKIDLQLLENKLVENKDLFINLMSNENILDHYLFSNLIISTLHLRDELIFRKNKAIISSDIVHLKEDSLRVYKNIVIQWIEYLHYLKKHYPYLYNNALNINPFIN